MKWGDRLVIDPNGVGQVECGGVHGVGLCSCLL